jgi:hypothetical protein
MDFQPEIKFLIYSCESIAYLGLPNGATINQNAIKHELERLITEIRNWDWLVECAKRNSVAPIFIYSMKQNGLFNVIPLETANQFEILLKEFTIRNLKLRSVFIEIANVLIKNEIQLMPLKGIVLQKMLYPNQLLRPMVDLDILVKNDDALKAYEILKNFGCREIVNSQSVFIGTLKHHFQPLTYKNVAIELHRSLTDSFDFVQFPEDELWSSALAFEIESINVKILNNYLLLLYLCHHVYSTQKGGSVKLIWYLDILLFLRKYGRPFDWEYFKNLVTSYKSEKSVYHSLGIVSFLFKSANLPEIIAVEIEKFCPAPSSIFEILMNDKIGSGNEHYLIKFKNIKGLRNKAMYLSGRLFPSVDFIKSKYKVGNSFGMPWAYLKEIGFFIKQSIQTMVYVFNRNIGPPH